MVDPKPRLGKGLGALLSDYMEPDVSGGDVRKIPIRDIVPNPAQPRRTFDVDELASLAESIRENGLLQPILVRPLTGVSGHYELVAGERRLRAMRLLSWSDAPAMVREVEDEILLILALVENLQREQLSPLEEAEGYQVLGDQHGLSHTEIARSVGKSRPTVANMIRLLSLPISVRKLLEVGDLTAGHARALLTVEDSIRAGELGRAAAREGWSVRETEERAKAASPKRNAPKGVKRERDPVVQALEEELRSVLGARVSLKTKRGGGGTIEVPFLSSEDFERLFHLIAGRDVSEVIG